LHSLWRGYATCPIGLRTWADRFALCRESIVARHQSTTTGKYWAARRTTLGFPCPSKPIEAFLVRSNELQEAL
jgi:hypothetical protein